MGLNNPKGQLLPRALGKVNVAPRPQDAPQSRECTCREGPAPHALEPPGPWQLPQGLGKGLPPALPASAARLCSPPLQPAGKKQTPQPSSLYRTLMKEQFLSFPSERKTRIPWKSASPLGKGLVGKTGCPFQAALTCRQATFHTADSHTQAMSTNNGWNRSGSAEFNFCLGSFLSFLVNAGF